MKKNPKNIEIRNLEPPKKARAYVFMKILEYPFPGSRRSRVIMVGNELQYTYFTYFKIHVCLVFHEKESSQISPTTGLDKQKIST